jgi:uncharacterized damage-inducible protein DinB
MNANNLLIYSDKCREVLRETLLANSAAFDRPFETSASLKSVRQLLSHMIGAEERWIEARIGGRTVHNYESRAAETVEAVYADWDSIRANTRAFIASKDEAELARVICVTFANGWQRRLSLDEILFHIFNHETHHRAQISMALMQFGIDPPDFDYCFHFGKFTSNE